MRAVIVAAALALLPAAAASQGSQKAPPAPPVEGAGAAPAGSAVPPPDTYTVKPGDTLWDLSGRFLNNPWYWPKVWSYNPEITNAHWIYPGNVIRFFAGTEEAPARIEPVAAPVAVADGAPEAEETELAPPRELEDLSRADLKKEPDYGDDDAVAVTGPYKVGYVAPKGTLTRRDTFMTVRELAEAGTITAAFEDKEMLSLHDRLYVRFRDPAQVKVGQTYVLFRTTREVVHPTSGARLGYQTSIIGAAKAVAHDAKATTVVITQASDAIERGDLVGPQAEKPLKIIARRPNQRQLSGLIVSSSVVATWLTGESHLVFVDKGRADGVEEGNVFTVTRAGDPHGQPLDVHNLSLAENRRLPTEDIGELLVVDAKDNFSTALVVRSLRELFAGDRVEMRTGGGSGGN
jgi:hypothetical protein